MRVLGAGDVQVAVAVCGMNFADLYTRQGLIRALQPPFVLGLECAGEVTAVGGSVEHLRVSRKHKIQNSCVVCNCTFSLLVFLVTSQ